MMSWSLIVFILALLIFVSCSYSGSVVRHMTATPIPVVSYSVPPSGILTDQLGNTVEFGSFNITEYKVDDHGGQYFSIGEKEYFLAINGRLFILQ